MTATQYFRAKVLDHVTGVASYTPPGRFLSLHTADPGVAGSHANEVTGGGYARLSLAGKMSAADSNGFSVNTVPLTIGPASSPWGTVTFLGYEEAVSGGNMMAPGVPSQPRTINTGGTFQIPAGQYRVRVS